MNTAALILCALSLIASPACHAAQSEDPLLQGNVEVSITSADLMLRELTQPPGLFVWNMIKDLDKLSTAQLRTLAHLSWITRRRDNESSAISLVVEAWADRDLAGAISDILTITGWEDADPWIGDNDVDLENYACVLWDRLARRDWKRALALAEQVTGAETAGHFFKGVAYHRSLSPEQLPAFLAVAARKAHGEILNKVIQSSVWDVVHYHGSAAARRGLAKMKDRVVRERAESEVPRGEREARASAGDKNGDSGQPVVRDPLLKGLLRLDARKDDEWYFPYPLLRAVEKLTPRAALILTQRIPPEDQVGHWLSWMLFMRAAEEDPVAALPAAATAGMGGVGATQPIATLYALRAEMDVETAVREIRAMTSPAMQREALSGYLTGGPARKIIASQQGSPLTALASQIQLPAQYWRPSLCGLAAAGEAEAALQMAEGLPADKIHARSTLIRNIMMAWGLSDLASLCRYGEKLEDGDRLEMVRLAMADVLPFLPASRQLDVEHPLPPKLLNEITDIHWPFMAYEAREAGFHFFVRHAKEDDYKRGIADFAEYAAKYEPERALALLQLVPGFEQRVTERMCERVAQFCPEKFGLVSAFLHGSEPWENLGGSLAKCCPDKAVSLLTNAPESSAWRGAAFEFTGSDPDKAIALFPRLSEADRKAVDEKIKERRRYRP